MKSNQPTIFSQPRTSSLALSENSSMAEGATWLAPSLPPFQICDIHFFSCTYDVEQVDFTHGSISQIAIPDSLCNAIHKRKAEFVVGRYCAQQALSLIGHCGSVDRHPDRSPIWPPSLVGSITHTQGFSMAAVASGVKWRGVGIDTESLSPHSQIESFSKQFIAPSELSLGIRSGLSKELSLYIVFSAKESVFKSLYPLVKKYFGFFDVEVISIDQLDSSHGSLLIRLTRDLAPFDRGFLLNGSYFMTDYYIHTLVAF